MDTERKNNSQTIPSHILRHFRAQAKSNKTFRAYSLSAGISTQTFYSWRKRYGKHFDTQIKKESPRSTPPSNDVFTTFPAHLLNGTSDALMEIYLNDSLKIRVYRGASAEWFSPFYKLLSGGHAVC